MPLPIPRFQGKTFKKKGGWSWEFIVSMLGEDEGQLFRCKNTFETKEKALDDLRLNINNGIKQLAELFPEIISKDTYIDMKTNTTRRFDKKDEN